MADEVTYQSEQDAAMALLTDVVSHLTSSSVDFVIVGGWVTKLFHSDRYPHPGTFDADILLNDNSLDDGSFEAATESMLARGYLRAAKNRFQAHRLFNVRGEQVLFHADFLNSRNPETLDVVVGRGRLQSVYTPAMSLVFSYGPFRVVDEARYPTLRGTRFASVDSFIATKAAALLVKKRPRDAFDIFVSIVDSPDLIGRRWESLQESDGMFRDAADTIRKAVLEGDAVEKTVNALPPGRHPPDFVREVFLRFVGTGQ